MESGSTASGALPAMIVLAASLCCSKHNGFEAVKLVRMLSPDPSAKGCCH